MSLKVEDTGRPVRELVGWSVCGLAGFRSDRDLIFTLLSFWGILPAFLMKNLSFTKFSILVKVFCLLFHCKIGSQICGPTGLL